VGRRKHFDPLDELATNKKTQKKAIATFANTVCVLARCTITAVPELLDMLDIKGDVVTADAGEPDGYREEDTGERSRLYIGRKTEPTELT
jgi:hypothetical protein